MLLCFPGMSLSQGSGAPRVKVGGGPALLYPGGGKCIIGGGFLPPTLVVTVPSGWQLARASGQQNHLRHSQCDQQLCNIPEPLMARTLILRGTPTSARVRDWTSRCKHRLPICPEQLQTPNELILNLA